MLSFEGYPKLQAGGLDQGGDIKRSILKIQCLSKPTTLFKMGYCSFFLYLANKRVFWLSQSKWEFVTVSIIIGCHVQYASCFPLGYLLSAEGTRHVQKLGKTKIKKQ